LEFSRFLLLLFSVDIIILLSDLFSHTSTCQYSIMSSRESAQAQRSSNIFGAPDGKKEEALLRRKEEYRHDLEQQMSDNAYTRRETRQHNKEHPLETRVERYAITQRKKAEVEEETVGEFIIGHEGKNASDIHQEQQDYQDRLTEDLQRKKEYLEHKDENDLKNRKPVKRSTSPTLDGEFVIGADPNENERIRRENAIAFAQGGAPSPGKDKRLGKEDHSGFFVGDDANHQLSKKDRKRLQYKQELDQQVDLFEQKKHAEAARIRDEDRYNARQNLPYSGNSDADVKRRQAIDKRQDFLQKASQNFPGQKIKQTNLDSKATFEIGAENNNSKFLAQKQADYKHALDDQMDQRLRRQRDEKESVRQEEQRFAEQNLPYLDNHDDE
jgi:hypothetical protein